MITFLFCVILAPLAVMAGIWVLAFLLGLILAIIRAFEQRAARKRTRALLKARLAQGAPFMALELRTAPVGMLR